MQLSFCGLHGLSYELKVIKGSYYVMQCSMHKISSATL